MVLPGNARLREPRRRRAALDRNDRRRARAASGDRRGHRPRGPRHPRRLPLSALHRRLHQDGARGVSGAPEHQHHPRRPGEGLGVLPRAPSVQPNGRGDFDVANPSPSGQEARPVDPEIRRARPGAPVPRGRAHGVGRGAIGARVGARGGGAARRGRRGGREAGPRGALGVAGAAPPLARRAGGALPPDWLLLSRAVGLSLGRMQSFPPLVATRV
mmetsp:Transcript_26441/g.79716  ORF Transcript_26441/g.79716 Transcript_26441/m.79716 type:complete len:215 (+) Transcript_26441:152-796(+)